MLTIASSSLFSDQAFMDPSKISNQNNFVLFLYIENFSKVESMNTPTHTFWKIGIDRDRLCFVSLNKSWTFPSHSNFNTNSIKTIPNSKDALFNLSKF